MSNAYSNDHDEDVHPEDELNSSLEGGELPDQITQAQEPQRSIYSGELPELASAEPWLAKSLRNSDELVSRPIQGARERAEARAGRVSYPPLTDLNDALAQRRRFDEQRTGRMWPSATPQTDAEQRLLNALCLAPGHVSAPRLARAFAQRYVRASLSPSIYNGDKLQKTDIFGIAYFGLGMQITTKRYRDHSIEAPVLATYDPQEPSIGLDDTIFTAPDAPPDAPVAWGHAAGDGIEPYVWQSAIDASFAARFFVAWAVAHQLSAILHAPLRARFVPIGTDPRLAHDAQPESIDRYRLAMLTISELLAPRWRLEKQIMWYLREQLPEQQAAACAGPNWRTALTHYFPRERDPLHRDPATMMVNALANRNFCPQSIIYFSLDGQRGAPAPQRWGLYLIHELGQQLANPDPTRISRYQQALLTYEHHYGYHKRWGQRQNLQLTLAL